MITAIIYNEQEKDYLPLCLQKVLFVPQKTHVAVPVLEICWSGHFHGSTAMAGLVADIRVHTVYLPQWWYNTMQSFKTFEQSLSVGPCIHNSISHCNKPAEQANNHLVFTASQQC